MTNHKDTIPARGRLLASGNSSQAQSYNSSRHSREGGNPDHQNTRLRVRLAMTISNEDQHKALSMESFAQSVGKFLSFNDFKVLNGLGSVSHQQAKQKAHSEYDTFNKSQKITSDFDKLNKKLRGKK